MKKYDVIALGELLIDFTDYGISEQTNPVFEANPGGAPCNVLALLKKYDRSCAFIGKIGEDLFGKMLTDILDEIGIDHKGLIVDPYYNTTLAFVKNFENGDREFSFYRHPGADMMLKASEVAYDLIRQAEIFHFGTLSMTDETVREATIQAIALAKEQGLLISFDPNLRPPLWKSLDEAKVQIAYGLGQCDVLKISDNEIEFMTDTSDFDGSISEYSIVESDCRCRWKLFLLSGEKGICTIVSAGRDSRYNRGRRYFLWQYIKLSFGA